jgi:Holliday junction resolvasome RuvABC endonuclease subunit
MINEKLSDNGRLSDLSDPFVIGVTRARTRACRAHTETSDRSDRTVLALDLGQRTGWAVRNREGAIASGTHEFRPSRFEGGGMIWLRFRAWLREIDETAGAIGTVFFEEVVAHRGVAASHCYAGFLAHLTAWAEANHVPYTGVPVGTIKRHVTGKSNADKQAVIEAVRKLGFAPADDNEVDTLALLHWALAQGIGGEP